MEKIVLPRAHPPYQFDASIKKADEIFVSKACRVLYLVNNGGAFRRYAIELGRNPVGHKLREGDCRTPEGQYLIDWKNPKSRFHLSLHISYPDSWDQARSQALGYHPGFDIMIHGTNPDQLGSKDWTHGCIAVLNHEMDEIFSLVDTPTPIWIQP